MKGFIIQQLIHNSILDWTHGAGYHIKRILVPEANNLAITSHQGQLFVIDGLNEGYDVLAEIDVPNELVTEALAYLRAKNQFGEFRTKIDTLVNSEGAL